MEADESRRRQSCIAIVVAGAGLLAALLALPWTHRAFAVTGARPFVLDQTGVHASPERLGIAAAVVTGILVALSAVGLLAPPRLKALLRRGDVALWLGGPLLLAFLGLKVLKDTRYLGIGAWISVVLGIVVAACALRLKPRAPRGVSG